LAGVRVPGGVGSLALFWLFVAAFLAGRLPIFLALWSHLPPALWVVVGDDVSMGGISALVSVWWLRLLCSGWAGWRASRSPCAG